MTLVIGFRWERKRNAEDQIERVEAERAELPVRIIAPFMFVDTMRQFQLMLNRYHAPFTDRLAILRVVEHYRLRITL